MIKREMVTIEVETDVYYCDRCGDKIETDQDPGGDYGVRPDWRVIRWTDGRGMNSMVPCRKCLDWFIGEFKHYAKPS
jgi:hypothetical protein